MESHAHIYTLRTSCYTCNQGARPSQISWLLCRRFQMERSGAERDRVNLTQRKKRRQMYRPHKQYNSKSAAWKKDDLHESWFWMWLQEQVLIGTINSTLAHVRVIQTGHGHFSSVKKQRLCKYFWRNTAIDETQMDFTHPTLQKAIRPKVYRLAEGYN